MNKKAELPRFLVILLVALAIIAGVSFALRNSGIPDSSANPSEAVVDFDATNLAKPGTPAPYVAEAADPNGKLRAIPSIGTAPLTVTFIPKYVGEIASLDFGDDTRVNVMCAEPGLSKNSCARVNPSVHTFAKPGTYTVLYRNGNDIVARVTIVAR